MDSNIRLRQLLDKYLQNRCTETEVQLLLDYLKRAENEPELKRVLSEYWQSIDEEKISGRSGSLVDKDEWFDEIYSQVQDKKDNRVHSITDAATKRREYTVPSVNNRMPSWLKIAAILLISFTLSYLFFNSQTDSSKDLVTTLQKVADAGEKIRFVLPDGSQVHLNSESRLTYPTKFPNSNREVHLEGEGYFIVTHDKDRPFVVHTKEITTKVLGTSFGIRSYPEDEEATVAVASGKVSVSESGFIEGNSNVILEPNEYASYTFTNRQFSTGEGIKAYTAWNSGVLLYHDKELGEVAYQLERWYGVEIHFENEAIKRCVVRGEHRDESLTNVLEAITYAFDMDYRIDGRQILLLGKGCN